MRGLLSLLGLLLAMYAAYLTLLYVSQRSVVFPGTGMHWDWDSQPLPAGARTVMFDASFGAVRSVLLPAESGRPAPALLYFHGNAEFVGQNVALLQPLAALGLHVLLVEYPGYAGSDGSPSRDSLGEAARLSYDWLLQQADVDASRIVAMGRSIGSGPAVALSAERELAALVLLSPFASLAELARSVGAPGFLLRDRYDNGALLRAFDRPVLLFHGRRDDIIPFRHALTLQDIASDARLITLDCRHNDCPYFDQAFVDALQAFLGAAGVLAVAGD
jgi:uncharacterized protein